MISDQFIVRNGETLTFNPTTNDIGTYMLKIILTDENTIDPLSKTYYMMVDVIKSSKEFTNNT